MRAMCLACINFGYIYCWIPKKLIISQITWITGSNHGFAFPTNLQLHDKQGAIDMRCFEMGHSKIFASNHTEANELIHITQKIIADTFLLCLSRSLGKSVVSLYFLFS